jgi:hypothetical protein
MICYLHPRESPLGKLGNRVVLGETKPSNGPSRNQTALNCPIETMARFVRVAELNGGAVVTSQPIPGTI